MKLWEAMLEGAKMSSPCMSTYQAYDTEGGQHACALGAVGYGAGIQFYGDRLPAWEARLTARFPELLDPAPCPMCRDSEQKADDAIGLIGWSTAPGSVMSAIECLFQYHKWSRQRIAEWLANRELKFTPAKQGVSSGV